MPIKAKTELPGDRGSDGYPYFGENQDYTPGQYEWPETGENKYDIAFQANNETEPTVLENARLEVSPDAVGMANIAGTFLLWLLYSAGRREPFLELSAEKPERAFEIYEDGTFCVKRNRNSSASGSKEQQRRQSGNPGDL